MPIFTLYRGVAAYKGAQSSGIDVTDARKIEQNAPLPIRKQILYSVPDLNIALAKQYLAGEIQHSYTVNHLFADIHRVS
jgi:hypothetical protein